MTDLGTFATTEQVVRSAGVNANATITASESITNDYVLRAEALINVMSMTDWKAIYSTTLNTNEKQILAVGAAAWAGKQLIKDDMSGFTSREEAQTMLDVLQDDFLNAVSVLRDVAKRKFMVA